MTDAKPPPSAEDVLDLTAAIERAHEELRILRTAIDELRDDVVWAARRVLDSGRDVASSSNTIPRADPLAPDIEPHAERLEHVSEDGEYCCERPKLAWHGDPELPGIACENCGYLVAEQGSILIWALEESNVDDRAQPIDPQKQLFD